jgi:hypothetical protein
MALAIGPSFGNSTNMKAAAACRAGTPVDPAVPVQYCQATIVRYDVRRSHTQGRRARGHRAQEIHGGFEAKRPS